MLTYADMSRRSSRRRSGRRFPRISNPRLSFKPQVSQFLLALLVQKYSKKYKSTKVQKLTQQQWYFAPPPLG
jgi:hypothetical protein